MAETKDQLVGEPDGADAEPAPPGDEEKAGCAEVRRRARGLTHHEAKAGLKEARSRLEGTGSGDRAQGDGAVRATAEVEEWERIVQLLADEAGAYDPAADAYFQGQLAARADHAKDRGDEAAADRHDADGQG
ncbi:hypothetical protein [Streptomyces sp. NBC_00344]|uniref:hypothetical protein n=1 Tax=Streptomyces sp. NBC_00344 TaxID=2975720 RepID=UPI002E23FB07